ncbi:DNA pol3 gamma3 superfamily incomplete domain containing protein [Pandoravirus celtis]|uniref:DNA pol3 gamma3 superfamily incomplete domain containing protein n=1 Tax=Pandoravirus celtis TaxID=2568002 RepID=A0A4D6EK38_9VIRU|nr:DNA pol3 gamma3 superfamily incomplete domain containing protein [Pandoravirus celtis]
MSTSLLVRVFDGGGTSPCLLGIACPDLGVTLAHVQDLIADAYMRIWPTKSPPVFRPRGPYALADTGRRCLFEPHQKVGDVLASYCPTNQLDAVRVDLALPTPPVREGAATPDPAVEWLSTRSTIVWPTSTPAAPPIGALTRAHPRAIKPKPPAAEIALVPQQAPAQDDVTAQARPQPLPASTAPVPAPTPSLSPLVPPARKTVRHTTDGRWLSAKDIVYDALSLWGTNSVLPARAMRAMRERYPEALDRRPVTGGGPHAPVVRVDDIAAFCTRLADILPPPHGPTALDYPKSKRYAEVLARLEAVSVFFSPSVQPTLLASDDRGVDLARAERDQSKHDAVEPYSGDTILRASPNDSCPTDDDASMVLSSTDEAALTTSGTHPLLAHRQDSSETDVHGDGTSDSDYAEQHERAASNQRPRRRRRRHDPAPLLQPRRSKRQKKSHHAGDDLRTANDSDNASLPDRQRDQCVTPSPTEPTPLSDRSLGSAEHLTSSSSSSSASRVLPLPPLNHHTAATQDAHYAHVVARIAARASARRPLRVWRWGNQRWRLILEATPARQGTHWPWQITYEAPLQGEPTVPSATLPPGTAWVEWDDMATLVRRCLVSPHHMAVVSVTRQVPLVEALARTDASSARGSHAASSYETDGDFFDDGDDDAINDTITAGDVASVVDGWVATACRQWVEAQSSDRPMPLDLARRMAVLAAAAAGTPYASRLQQLATAATVHGGDHANRVFGRP